MKELHVVAVSGGKDSTAMALRLLEIEPREYTYVCTPTGNELPEMFAHWRLLGTLFGKPVLPIVGGSLDGLIRSQEALPNWRQRWCTRMLKIEPYAAWLLEESKQHDAITSYVGIRADEEERESGDYSDVPNVTMRYPLREWGWKLADVQNYLHDRGVTIPKRSDCAVCFYQRLGEWWALWRDYPEEYAKGEAYETMTGHTFRSPGRDNWPASLSELRARFEAGHIPSDSDLQGDLFGAMQCRVCRL